MPSSTTTAPRAEPPLGSADRALLRLLAELKSRRYRFITVSPSTHALVNARPENALARDLTGVFGWSRPFEPGLVPPDIRAAMEEGGVVEPAGDGRWRSTVRVSSLGAHLLLHSAYPTTHPESVFFGPDTYRFARAIQHGFRARSAPIRRAIDIGCGAGPGAIVVAESAPAADIVMADINGGALRFAQINAAFAGAARCRAIRSDLLADVDGEFDLIVSNPPYLNDPLSRAYRHGGGRFGEALSLRILEASLPRLAPGGMLILYTGVAMTAGRDPFWDAAADMLAPQSHSWTYEEIDPDVFGEELAADAYVEADRIAAVVLTVTRGP